MTIPSEEDPSTIQYQEKKSDEAELRALAADMPVPVPDAIAASKQKDAQTQADIKKAEEQFDYKGRHFDASLHATDAHGQPIRTPTGRFKRKLRLPENTTSTDQKVIDPLMVEAEKYADMFICGGMGFVGDEFKPADGERQSLVVAWYAIFQKYGIMPIHPVCGLLVAHSLYIFRRYEKPRTKSILDKAFTSVKFFFINLWGKINGKDYKIVPKEGNK